ncbi:MAG: hypothetical protein ACRD68_01215 [Pyrinomonadaceae bacterium]
MGALLTYHLRRGLLTGVASGKYFRLPTHQDPSGIAAWEQARKSGSGKITLWDHCFELPHQHHSGKSIPDSVPAGSVGHKLQPGGKDKLGLYDYPGEYAQRFDGIGTKGRPVHHTHPGAAVYVGDRSVGTYIHGWPPCNLKECVVVMHRWDELLQAITEEKNLTLHIEY